MYFSPGTLQYVFGSRDATLASGARASGTWRFAARQYDYISATDNLARMRSKTTGQVIDLFAWGSSGVNYESGQHYLPWTLDQSATSKFGPSSGSLSGTSDWGTNTISNASPSTGWRTLSETEWEVIACSGGRTGYDRLIGFASIDGVKGYLFLPDDFVFPDGFPAFKYGVSSYSHFPVRNNAYTAAQWALLEKAGAIFMPGHGKISRDGAIYENQELGEFRDFMQQTSGLYWFGGFFSLSKHQFGTSYSSTSADRGDKLPVRLVRDAPAGNTGLNAALQQTGFVLSRYTQKTGVTVLYNGTDVTASATVSWSIDNSSVATMAVTPNSAGVAGAGITVTPVAAGNATITCRITYGGQTKVLTAGVIVSQ